MRTSNLPIRNISYVVYTYVPAIGFYPTNVLLQKTLPHTFASFYNYNVHVLYPSKLYSHYSELHQNEVKHVYSKKKKES